MAELAKLVEELSQLSVLEASELVKLLEEKWGVSAAAPVAAVAAGPAVAAAEEEVEEKFEEEDELKPETIDEIRNFEPLSVDESKVDRHSRLHFGEISQAKDKNPSILNPETNGKKAPKWRKMI